MPKSKYIIDEYRSPPDDSGNRKLIFRIIHMSGKYAPTFIPDNNKGRDAIPNDFKRNVTWYPGVNVTLDTFNRLYQMTEEAMVKRAAGATGLTGII